MASASAAASAVSPTQGMGISDIYNSALSADQKTQVNNAVGMAKQYGTAAIIIAIVVFLIVLIVALWFIWDAKDGVVRNLRLWIPLVLFFALLVNFRLFFILAFIFIIFSLWFYVTAARQHEDRVLAYGCDYRKKLEECGCDNSKDPSRTIFEGSNSNW